MHGCRLTRTLNDSRRGLGRPDGVLTAFLLQAEEFPDAESHKLGFRRDFETRQQARAQFRGLPRAERFLALERAQHEDEEHSEPVEMR